MYSLDGYDVSSHTNTRFKNVLTCEFGMWLQEVASPLILLSCHAPDGATDMSRAAGSSTGREAGLASPDGLRVSETEYLRSEFAGKSRWARWAWMRGGGA